MSKPIISSAIANVKHMAAFDTLAAERFGAIDLSKLLIDMYDVMPAELLDYMARELDMLGYNGWILAETEEEKRELLKASTSLKKIKGTPAGIREVLRRLGFIDVVIEEGWENFTDGSDAPDDPEHEAYFRLVYVLPNNKSITPEIAANLAGLINEYKSAGSVLANVGFAVPQRDRMIGKGRVLLKVYDNDVLIEDSVSENTITYWGFFFLLQNTIWVQQSEGFPYSVGGVNEISFSTDGTPNGQTEEGNLLSGFTKPMDYITGPLNFNETDGGVLRVFVGYKCGFSLSTTENNGMNIREMGMIFRNRYILDTPDTLGMVERFEFPDSDHVFNRIARAPIIKTNTIRIEGVWEILFGNL